MKFLRNGRHILTVHKRQDTPSSKNYQLSVWDFAGRQIQSVACLFAIRSLAVSDDGSQIALGCADKKVRFYDGGDRSLLRVFRAHDAPVTALEFHPNQPRLATGSEDRSIKIWDTSTLRRTRSLYGCLATIEDLRFSPNGSMLGAYADDRVLRIWKTDQEINDTFSWPSGEALQLTPLPDLPLPVALKDDQSKQLIPTADSGRRQRKHGQHAEISRDASFRVFPPTAPPEWNAHLLLGYWREAPDFVAKVQSEQEPPHVEIFLAKKSVIHSMKIETRSLRYIRNQAARLTISASDDGRQWRQIWRADKSIQYWAINFDKPVTARHLKIGLTDRGTLQLRSVTVFGE